ncbi:MAG: serine/threonine-protein kinase, partial [Verrucomicrobiota bacterium]
MNRRMQGASSSKLENRYQFHSALGRGGAGEVFTAWDTQLERTVAVKRITSSGIHEDVVQSTWQEGMRLAAIRHSNIVAVYDMGMDGETPYVVMEYVQGETIEERVPKGILTMEEFVEVARQSLEGLLAAHHAGLVHRDIKPSNLMISLLPSGALQMKILDFGIAKFHTRPAHMDVNTDGTVTGSIHCISPEQLTLESVDFRSDLYSLGCVFYYALAGIYPFDANRVSEIVTAHLEHYVIPLSNYRPDLPASICDWVMVLINRQPTDRFQSAMQALAALQNILAPTFSVRAPAQIGNSHTETQRPSGKRGALLALGLAGACILVVIAIAFLWRTTSPDKTVQGAFPPEPTSLAQPGSPTSGKTASAPLPVEPPQKQITDEGASIPEPVAPQSIPVKLPMAEASPVEVSESERILLRIHGSNTIGAKLLPELMVRFLQKEGVTAIERKPSKNAEQIAIQAKFPDIGLGVIEIAAHGSTTAFQGLIGQSCEIGMSSRPIKSEEAATCAMAGLGDMRSPECEHVVGLDGIAILVHRENPITTLSKDQIAEIFSGKITDWAQIGGPAGQIRIYARDSKSGTFDTFKSLVLGNAALATQSKAFEDSSALSEAVATDKAGIGFAGLAFIGAT